MSEQEINRRVTELREYVSQVDSEVEGLKGLNTVVAVNNERLAQLIEGVESLAASVGEIDTVIFKGTEHSEAMTTRISKLEGFSTRTKKWGGIVVGIVGTLIAGLIATRFTSIFGG